jgi:hypothetical protein
MADFLSRHNNLPWLPTFRRERSTPFISHSMQGWLITLEWFGILNSSCVLDISNGCLIGRPG